MPGYTVIPGRGARRDFVEGLASALGADIVEPIAKEFPDGETYVRVEGEVNGTPVVVQGLYPEQNNRLVELLLLVEAVHAYTGRDPVVVLPYLAYARQDKRFLPGEPISVHVVLKALEASGGGHLVVVDAHKPEALSVYTPGYTNVLPAEAFAEKIRGIAEGREAVVVAPDKGALGRAEALAKLLGARHDYLVKKRDRVTGEVKYMPRHVEVKGALVILVDDIVSTGGTMAKAAEILYSQGAGSVIAACSHGLFIGNALEKMKRAGIREVYAANTVPLPEDVEVVDVSKLVARALTERLKRG